MGLSCSSTNPQAPALSLWSGGSFHFPLAGEGTKLRPPPRTNSRSAPSKPRRAKVEAIPFRSPSRPPFPPAAAVLLCPSAAPEPPEVGLASRPLTFTSAKAITTSAVPRSHLGMPCPLSELLLPRGGIPSPLNEPLSPSSAPSRVPRTSETPLERRKAGPPP